MIPYEKIVAEDLNLGTATVALAAPAGGLMPGTQINLGTFGLVGSKTWASGSVASLARVTTTVTVAGAAVGDVVVVGHDGLAAGWMLFGAVTAADTVSVTAFNASTGALSFTGTLRVATFTLAV